MLCCDLNLYRGYLFYERNERGRSLGGLVNAERDVHVAPSMIVGKNASAHWIVSQPKQTNNKMHPTQINQNKQI
jgi:hypothetical protein